MRKLKTAILFPFCLAGVAAGTWAKYHGAQWIVFKAVCREARALASVASLPTKTKTE